MKHTVGKVVLARANAGSRQCWKATPATMRVGTEGHSSVRIELEALPTDASKRHQHETVVGMPPDLARALARDLAAAADVLDHYRRKPREAGASVANERIHLVIDGDVTGTGTELAIALRRLANDVEAYDNAELVGATFKLEARNVSASVECRETGEEVAPV